MVRSVGMQVPGVSPRKPGRESLQDLPESHCSMLGTKNGAATFDLVMGRERQGRGTRENCSVTWLVVSVFMVMGFVFGLSLANRSDSESFLVVHTFFSQDRCQLERFWEVVEHVVSPFDLSWTLPVGGGLLVLCSLPGTPIIKQLMQMVTMVPHQGGPFQSVCFP